MGINFNIIKLHKQIAQNSCVPMSVECVLKLTGIVRPDFFEFQNDPQKIGTSNWVKGFMYPEEKPKVLFNRQFLPTDLGQSENRGDYFMSNLFHKLFDTIDKELENKRFVIITLDSGPNYHNYIVYDRENDSTYKLLTFFHGNPNPFTSSVNLKQRVSQMGGTDILTYEEIHD